MQASVKHGGPGVLVWGYMSSFELGELVFIQEIMDKFVYLRILKGNFKQSAEKLGLGNNCHYQQDNTLNITEILCAYG